MFDTTIVGLPRAQHTQQTHVHIKEAGAVDAAKLLNDLQETASARVRNAIVASLTPFNAEVVKFEVVNSVLDAPGTADVYCSFVVNGRPHHIKLKTCQQTNEGLARAICEAIAGRLMDEIVAKCPRVFFPSKF